MAGNNPGDGKSAPFGPGANAGGKFDPKAGRGTDAAGKAPPFDQFAQKNPQGSKPAVENVELGGASGEPAGGKIIHADPKGANPERAREIGAGSIGNGYKPFRVGGGGK